MTKVKGFFINKLRKPLSPHWLIDSGFESSLLAEPDNEFEAALVDLDVVRFNELVQKLRIGVRGLIKTRRQM